MKKDCYEELEGRDIGNPFTLLLYAFRAGKTNDCVEILTNIHFYLFRKRPPASLRKQWIKELAGSSAKCPRRDFIMKIVRNRTRSDRCYFVRLTETDCGLDYSNESNAMGLEFGPRAQIVRRGFQLCGLYLDESSSQTKGAKCNQKDGKG